MVEITDEMIRAGVIASSKYWGHIGLSGRHSPEDHVRLIYEAMFTAAPKQESDDMLPKAGWEVSLSIEDAKSWLQDTIQQAIQEALAPKAIPEESIPEEAIELFPEWELAKIFLEEARECAFDLNLDTDTSMYCVLAQVLSYFFDKGWSIDVAKEEVEYIKNEVLV